MTTHSSILAWKIPQTEESGWLMGSKRVRHDCKTEHACRQAGTLQNTASEGKKKKQSRGSWKGGIYGDGFLPYSPYVLLLLLLFLLI